MTIKPLSYKDEITLDDAKERLKEAQDEFDGLKSKYTKGLRKYQFWMSEGDRKKLWDVIDVLLPLTTQESVEEEALLDTDRENHVIHRAGDLLFKSSDMLAHYINTPEKRINYSTPFWKD